MNAILESALSELRWCAARSDGMSASLSSVECRALLDQIERIDDIREAAAFGAELDSVSGDDATDFLAAVRVWLRRLKYDEHDQSLLVRFDRFLGECAHAIRTDDAEVPA